MTVNVSNEEIVIAAGAIEPRDLPGGQLICYASTDEALVSMDGRGWLPFSRGIELNAPDGKFSKLYFRNDTASEITLKVAVVSEARVFVDRRELAAQVALNGDIRVVNSPYLDEGGLVKKPSSSIYNVWHDTTGVAYDADIITAAQNVNGVRLRRFSVWITTAPASSLAFFYIAGGAPNYPFQWSSVGIKEKDIEHWMPAGRSLNLNIPLGFTGRIQVEYDIE